MRRKAVTLLSAGLDSTVATALARKDYDVALALTFDYGQRAAAREIECAKSLCKLWSIEHKVIELPWLGDETHTALVDTGRSLPKVDSNSLDHDAESRAADVWVPNRNALFVSIAASFAEARGCSAIIAGLNTEEAGAFPDNSKEFVDASNELLKFSTRSDVRLVCPTVDMTKKDIAKQFASLEIPADSFWCCYEGSDSLCGRCESCVRTVRAFKSAKLWNMAEHRFSCPR